MPIHRRFRSIPIEKKRIFLLFFALMLLAAALIAFYLVNRPVQQEEAAVPQDFPLQLVETAYSDVVSITIRRGNESPWTAVYTGGDGLTDESVTILGEDGFTLTWEESISFLLGAVCITAEEVLTDNPADYLDHLADFGLDEPEFEAQIVYVHSPSLHLRVGDKGPDGTWRYMLIDGDDRLYAFSNGSVDALFVNRDTLRKVSQPPLHKARIDRVTLTTPGGVIEWTLAGDIHDMDAIDRWRITEPFQYPADAAAMANLLKSVAGIRLGAYISPATPEKLARFGFDAPRLTIDIHQAAGTIATNNASGAAEAVDYPEQTLTYVIGGEKSDLIDYVLLDGQLYTTSRFNIGMFLDYDVRATMSRYPVMVALGNLASLSITDSSGTKDYILTRTEQVAPNNELITDADGNPVYDVTVTCNGKTVAYAAFEAAYHALSQVTMSGMLPKDAAITDVPHTVYTFTDVDGTVHTVALAAFDALHDAVIVDGHAAFYLINGGFSLKLD